MRKWTLATLSVMIFVLTVALVFPGMTMAAPKKYVVAWYADPQAGMNPFNSSEHSDVIFQPFIYEPLMIHTWLGEDLPWLAESCTYDAGNDTWVVKLRDKANWHDGKPVTVEDLKFSLEAAWKYKAIMGDKSKGMIESITAKDSKTAVFKLKDKLAAFPVVIGAIQPVPKHLWKDVGDVTKYQNPNPVGCGPFKYREYVQGSYLAMTAYKDHWRGAPAMDELVIRIFANMQAEAVALKKGEVDFIPDLAGTENILRLLENDKNVKVRMEMTNNILYIALNYYFDVMKVKGFRQALDLTIPKEKIINVALAKRAELPLMGYIPPVVSKWSNTKLVWKPLEMKEADRFKAANKILDDMGWKKGSDGVRSTDKGKRLEFSIKCANDPTFVRAAEMIVNSWEKIGVKCKVEAMERRTLYPGTVYNAKDKKDWTFMLHRSVLRGDPDHFAREYAPETDSFWPNANAFGWVHKEAQDLLKASRREMNESKRIQQIMKVQELFADDLTVLSIAHKHMGYAYRNDRFVNTNTKSAYTSYIAILNVASMKAK